MIGLIVLVVALVILAVLVLARSSRTTGFSPVVPSTLIPERWE